MVTGDGFDELRRTAYGRDSSSEERAAAIRTLRQLEKSRERASAPSPIPPPPAPLVASHEPAPPAAERIEPEPSVSPAPRAVAEVRALWLIPIIAGSLALGALGATLWGTSGQRSAVGETPGAQATVPVIRNDTNNPVGDLDAATKLFATPATGRESYPHTELLPELRLSTVRYLGGDQALLRAWVAKDSEGEICLLLDQNGTGAATCNTTSDFVSRGISLGINQFSASWNGRDWAISSPDGYRQGLSGP